MTELAFIFMAGYSNVEVEKFRKVPYNYGTLSSDKKRAVDMSNDLREPALKTAKQ